MKRLIFIPVLSILICILLLASCDSFSDGNFDGGDILDDEMMDSIKDELFSSDTESETEEHTVKIEGVSDTETTAAESQVKNDTVSEEAEDSAATTEEQDNESVSTETCESEETHTHGTETNEAVTEDKSVNEKVCWTQGGEVWHLSADCNYLNKSKEVLYGTVEEAMEAGKTRLCSGCDKKYND